MGSAQLPVQNQSSEFRTGLDHLERVGLVRVLPPWFRNLDKQLRRQPKVFIRDTGLLHASHRCRNPAELSAKPQIHGDSWESFYVEALISAAPDGTQSHYHRSDGDELDLVLDFGGNRRWGIEIKHGVEPTPSAGFYRGSDEVGVEQRFVVTAV